MKPKQTPSKTKSKAVWLVLAVAILFGGIAWYSMRTPTPTPAPQEAQVQMPSPMKLVTLPPSMFIGRARDAYQVAQDIPEVLQQLPCFCGCKQFAGHENNLYCFMDNHGQTCSMCQNIAFDAKKLHDSGTPIAQIREAIIVKYEHAEQ